MFDVEYEGKRRFFVITRGDAVHSLLREMLSKEMEFKLETGRNLIWSERLFSLFISDYGINLDYPPSMLFKWFTEAKLFALNTATFDTSLDSDDIYYRYICNNLQKGSRYDYSGRISFEKPDIFYVSTDSFKNIKQALSSGEEEIEIDF